jgi:hypothetical protein
METRDRPVPSTLSRLRTPLIREELIGMIWAAAGPVRVPARCWPMQIALAVLDTQVPAIGRVDRVLGEWPESVSSHGRHRNNVDSILRDLAIAGLLSVEGRGWDAGYRPSAAWLAQGAAALASLTRSERAAVRLAAQKLIASLTIWSKNSVTCVPDRSVTS